MLKKFSVAPLYNYTDKHCRYFYSLFTNNINLYTGMIYSSYFIKNYKKINFFNYINNVPVFIQFIGNNCYHLYKSAKIVKNLNYSGINFNLGCPSKSSYFGNMGFYLMSNIKHTINCINSLSLGSNGIQISVKHRINYNYSYNDLLDFLGNISLFTKCKLFIIHARSILKNNFSTKLNLNLPNLNYDYVYKLKKDLPHLNIILNGNLNNLIDIDNHLNYVDGVMLGRGIYFNPLILFDINNYLKDRKKILSLNLNDTNRIFFCKNKINIKLRLIFFKLYLYILKEVNLYNTNPINIIKHVIYIFKGIKNASCFRKKLIYFSYNLNKFLYFSDFENFLYKDYI